MTNLEKYNQIFAEVFSVEESQLGAEFDKAHQRRNIVKNDIEKIFRKYINKFLEQEITYK